MAGCLDNIGRRNKVNPAEHQPKYINEGKWEEKEPTLYINHSHSSNIQNSEENVLHADKPHDPIEEQHTDLTTTNVVRKSSKAKRVKSYLKKCKDAALAATHFTETSHDTEQKRLELREDSKIKNGDEICEQKYSCTSWYVESALSASSVLTDDEIDQNLVDELPESNCNLVSVIEIDGSALYEDVLSSLCHSDNNGNDDNNADNEIINPSLISDDIYCEIDPERHKKGSDEVIDSRNEGGTISTVIKISPTTSDISTIPQDIVIKPEIIEESSTSSLSKYATATQTNTEVKCDVASLVEKHFGCIYPNFCNVRNLLVRQARDLLVCTFHGNLTRFEKEFCVPSAKLLLQLHHSSIREGWDVVTPRGWPLSLGVSGVAVHLGELDPTLLRNRDCYLCVRGTLSGVELVLVWKRDSVISSRVLDTNVLESPLGLEKMEEEPLAGVLQSLLVSVERAIERVPIDDLAFPCPECHEYLLEADCDGKVASPGNADKCGCSCACQQTVQKRDTCIQTSPMFEYVGTIPHIDSDDDDDLDKSKRRNSRIIDGNITTKLTESAATQTLPRRKEVVMPQSIADLPDKLLMAGVFLPGIHDAAGRAVVLCDMPTLFRAGVNYHKVATLLLYYSSLPRPDRLKDGFTILAVSSSTGEQVALLVLDKAMALLLDRVKFHKVLLWRQTQSSNHKDHRHEIRSNLERSKVQCEIVGENELRQYISDDQLPVTCGGRANHDQLEWVEFRKELEPFLIQCHGCGRRLATAMTDLRNSENQTQTSRRQLHHQHRILSRAVNDQELQRLRREGAKTLSRIEERAQWLPASEDVRMSVDRARRLFQEVDRAAKRLEQLSEGRREKLKDLARLRAIEDETSQVLSWLCKKGEETLKRHTELATNLPGIKVQEQDFEKFYFISMRHLDKGNDLLEEAGQCSVGDTRSSTPGAGNSGGSALRDLARSLKHHLRGFSDRLEDTRERLEDTSRCFYLLDKAYEWALETMKYMSRIKIEDTATAEQTLHMLKQLQQYLMAHPAITEEHFTEMWQLAKKLGNEKLLDQCKVAHSRCQETMEMIRTQQSRLTDLRQQLVDEDLDYLEYPSLTTPTSPKPQHHNWNQSSFVSSTPVQSGTGRRRSVGSFPYIYKCSHHAAGHSCSCYDPTPSSTVLEESRDCHCSRLNNLDNIQEVRESAEDLLDVDSDVNKARGDSVCERCSAQNSITNRIHSKRNLQRSCTWQYPTESFDEDGDCSSRLCDELNDGRKCDYSTDTSGDNTTEGSEGFPKSADDLDDQEGNCGSKCIPPVPVNSHLHCHPSSLDLHSPSGDRDAKTQKTLLLIMREMIQTERDYVKSLDYIIENYIPQLLREDIPQALRGQRNVIFGNVEKIYEFHSQYFLQELERCENRPLQVGKCFLRHENKFYLYALYNKNKPKSDALMSEYGTLFFKTKQLELGDKMDLASYLLKPVQRMGKYALLLQQLMKAYPEKDKDGDIGELKAAEKMVRFQLRHGNDLLAMDSLRDCDVNVKEQGRLLRQNEFLVWQGKGKKCLRHVFLFEELILFSKARRFPDRKNLDLYIYKNSIKMTDIGLTAKVGDSTTKFEIWFRKRKPNDTFTLQSMSEDVKKSWTEEISKLLWKQAMRNREMRMAEMSSMGIGNKPCLDIRPSADQISDRSISIAQLSKTAPRFRNSITVTAGELQRSNKRPHSIISVSSSSSGGSSGSQSSGSGSGCGTLNLGFDSHESPHLPHRSTTLHSQGSVESGIIADMSLSSEDTEGSGPHWHVERSNSSATSISLESSMSPTSPMSPSEEDKTCLTKIQDSYNSEADSEELSIKL